MGNQVGEKDSIKGLILASVFMNCYLCDRELAVLGLLDSDQMLSSHYAHRSHVLSNMLRRYYKQGLLYRIEENWRGHRYLYGMTKKGVLRLRWMCTNRRRYSFKGRDVLEPVRTVFIHIIEERRDESKRRAESEHQEISRLLSHREKRETSHLD